MEQENLYSRCTYCKNCINNNCIYKRSEFECGRWIPDKPKIALAARGQDLSVSDLISLLKL